MRVVPRHLASRREPDGVALQGRLDDVLHVVRSEPAHAEPVERRRPHDARIEAEALRVGQTERLGSRLRGAIGAERAVASRDQRMVGVDRLVQDTADHADRREAHEPLDVRQARGLEQVERATEIRVHRDHGMGVEIGRVHDRPGMHDRCRPVPHEDLDDQRPVIDRAALENHGIRPCTEQEPRLAAKIREIEADDIVPGVEELLDDVAAGETGAAGHEDWPLRTHAPPIRSTKLYYHHTIDRPSEPPTRRDGGAGSWRVIPSTTSSSSRSASGPRRCETASTRRRTAPASAPTCRAAQAYLRAMKAEGGWAVGLHRVLLDPPESDEQPTARRALWDDGDIRNLALMCDARARARRARRHRALATAA